MTFEADRGTSRVLTTLGKEFHRDAAATANEPSPALVRGRFTSSLLLLAQRSALVGWYGRHSSRRHMSLCMALYVFKWIPMAHRLSLRKHVRFNADSLLRQRGRNQSHPHASGFVIVGKSRDQNANILVSS